jgi:type IV pilin
MNIFMKKIIMLAILAMTLVSCGLLDPQLWDEARERREERGERCYKKYNGNVYCEDKYGNRTY